MASGSLPLKKATLIYNPAAGRGSSRRERQMRQAAAALQAAGISTALRPTTAPMAARQLASQAVAEGAEIVLACGGDGTLNEVINGLVPGKAALGVLPGGTANIFARELGIPMSPVAAARALTEWKPRRIALGRATWRDPEEDSRYFLSLAGVGFDAYVVRAVSRAAARRSGVFAYGWQAMLQAARYRCPQISLRSEAGETTATFAVAQRTERYAGWLHLAPGASVFRDDFTVSLFNSPRRARYFLYALAVVARRHPRLKDVELFRTRRLDCAAADPSLPIYFELDGELAGRLPVRLEIVPDALSVLLP
jgi:diacylglycerol kinase (ATP)